MKAKELSKWGVALSVAGMLAVQAMGQQAGPTQSAAKAPQHKRVIVVSLEDRKLALIEDGNLKRIYTVAVGKPSTPSPTGTFMIERRVKNPVYRHDGKTVEPGPENPVGTRWMGLSVKGYGIHGTNAPKSIGKAASHGCIRMGKTDIEDLFDKVEVGDTVELIGQRNEETAQLFGPPKTAPAVQPLVIADATPVPQATPLAASTDGGGTVNSIAVTGN